MEEKKIFVGRRTGLVLLEGSTRLNFYFYRKKNSKLRKLLRTKIDLRRVRTEVIRILRCIFEGEDVKEIKKLTPIESYQFYYRVGKTIVRVGYYPQISLKFRAPGWVIERIYNYFLEE